MQAPAHKKTIRTSVMLPEAIHTRIQTLADANDVSAAWIIRAAVMQFLAEYGEETKLPLRLPKIKEGNLT
ncbi:ribbon-helix-helix domain-containing protein [Rhizobium rhizogenes]|uniref:ribbon-helix-helix domain-containing protein n=2 Tax=Rhizobium rhizogenes TaxID=359 RepID=UPI001960E64A|nr:CopG family transcriptional regulator [Rhizobium rhizogenes]